jgi:transcriptional regulator GlxA family with amidase domain
MATNIIFLILPEIHLLDLAGPDQVFHEAMEYGADIKLQYCSFDNNITTSTTIPFGKLKHFSTIIPRPGDYIFIPGANVSFLLSLKMTTQKNLFQWINSCYNSGVIICSVCTGAFFLAQTGLLNGRKCTTHWKRTKELQEKFPAVNVVENILFTEDERIFTSAGVTAGIDMALYILGILQGDNFSYKVARELLIYLRRQGSAAQESVFMRYRNHIHAGVHSVQDYIQENIAAKITISQLADVAFMSSRNLTRIFKKEIGIPVNEYINLVRKEKIAELLKNPDITRAQIAKQCGLTSVRHLSRLIQSL